MSFMLDEGNKAQFFFSGNNKIGRGVEGGEKYAPQLLPEPRRNIISQ
jgi:hypothetical protein